MRHAHGVRRQRTVFRKGRHFHTGREFIMGWTRWGEVIIRIIPQPRQERLLHGGDSVSDYGGFLMGRETF